MKTNPQIAQITQIPKKEAAEKPGKVFDSWPFQKTSLPSA
jgi:hypothetical protein